MFSCGMWDIAPQSGIELRPPALGVWSVSHWTTREIPEIFKLSSAEMEKAVDREVIERLEIKWRRKWQPTPVFLPGKSHGRWSLVGCSPWGREESDTTEKFTFTFHSYALEKKMATHSIILAWRMPGTEEPGGLPSIGSHRFGHDWSDLAAAAVEIKMFAFGHTEFETIC